MIDRIAPLDNSQVDGQLVAQAGIVQGITPVRVILSIQAQSEPLDIEASF
jgi:hypothetical protein